MFNWTRKPLVKDKDGKFILKEDGTYERGADEFTRVQGALRPIQLYEYVFPKECLPEVAAMLGMHDIKSTRPEISNFSWILRKMMKLKPWPEFPELKGKTTQQITSKYVPLQGIAAYPIGIREDDKKDYPNYGYYQEGL